jgi:ubiquitin-conjugating enzyme E2 S
MAAVLGAQVVRQLVRELHGLQEAPCEGIRVLVNEQNLGDVQAEIEGPAGTPYSGAVFRMKLALGADYPGSPPKGYFVTKIFHPNIHPKSGEICVSVLKKDWTAEMGLKHVLMVIRCLLIQPFPDSALNEEAGKLLLEDYAAYAKHARLMTDIHAPKVYMPLNESGGNVSAGSSGEAAGKDAAAPALKKAKPDKKPTVGGAANVKKSLKRL